jgi:hypothetical protein
MNFKKLSHTRRAMNKFNKKNISTKLMFLNPFVRFGRVVCTSQLLHTDMITSATISETVSVISLFGSNKNIMSLYASVYAMSMFPFMFWEILEI